MTPFERLALDALSHASFGMSSPRRFVLDVAAKPDDYELSPRQRWNLARLAWRYRRQLPREVSDWALETSAGAPAPPCAPVQKRVLERKTKSDQARAVLAQPLQFGNAAQAEANRLLARRRV